MSDTNSKIKIPRALGIKRILQMIKPEVLAQECGIPYKTLMAKANGQVVRGESLVLFDKDIEKINEVLPKIAQMINKIVVPYYDPKGVDIVSKDKPFEKVKKAFQMTFFYENKFGKDCKWMSRRMQPYSTERKNYYFKEDEIITINMAIKEASSMLMSIELI